MTDDESPIASVKTAAQVVGEIVKTAGDTPEAKEAARQLGRAAVTITKAVNVFLLPLAAMNFAVEKARAYFESGKFAADFGNVAIDIPPENLVEPKGSLAGPLLQALAFSHEEHELRQMYLRLLAAGMDKRTQQIAHPSFVEIIKQLNAQEAAFLASLKWSRWNHTIVELRLRVSSRFSMKLGYQVLHTHLFYRAMKDGTPIESADTAVMIDNLCRLGLVRVTYGVSAGDSETAQDADELYSWVDSRPEFLRLKQEHGSRLIVVRGILAPTEFGVGFAAAVGIQSESSRNIKG